MVLVLLKGRFNYGVLPEFGLPYNAFFYVAVPIHYLIVTLEMVYVSALIASSVLCRMVLAADIISLRD